MYAQTRRHVFWSLFGILLDVWYWYWLLFVMITFLVMISSTPSQSHKTSPKSLCMTLWLSNSCASDNLGFNLSQVRGNFNSFTGYRKYKQGWRKRVEITRKKITCRKNHPYKKITCRKKSPVERVKTSILEPHHKSWIAPLHGRAGISFIIKMMIMKWWLWWRWWWCRWRWWRWWRWLWWWWRWWWPGVAGQRCRPASNSFHCRSRRSWYSIFLVEIFSYYWWEYFDIFQDPDR